MSRLFGDTADPVLLMCSPEFYEISAPDPQNGHPNAFAEVGHREYMKDPRGFVDLAVRQWKNLRSHFNALGLNIVELEPLEGYGDLTFTADPTLSLVTTTAEEACDSDCRAITIASKFSNTERQIEVDRSIRFIKEHISDRDIAQAPHHTEGTGDNFYDAFRDIYWSGYVCNAGRQNAASGRSDRAAHAELRKMTGVPVVSMAVKRPFFHIDTSMTPLTKGHIIAYPDGMKPEAFDTLMQEGFGRYGMDPEEFLIPVDAEDAARYACNLRCVGDTVVMPTCSEDLQERIRAKGYDVVTSDMSQFIYDGGAMHCLTNNINEQRVVGGTCVEYGYERQPKCAR